MSENIHIDKEKRELVFRVPFDVLPVAVKAALASEPGWWNHEDDTPKYEATDPDVFAVELARELNREREDGSTVIDLMLDAAVIRAIENGAEGVTETPVSVAQREADNAGE